MSDVTEAQPQTVEPTPSPEPTVSEPVGSKLDQIINSAIETHAPDEAPQETAAEAKARDEKGRFASTKPAGDAVSTEAAADPAKPAPTPTEPAVEQPIQAPVKWSEADKATFAKLTPEAQKLTLERYGAMEADYTRKTQALAETHRTVEPLINEVNRWSPYLQQLGKAPERAFAEMLQAEWYLRNGDVNQKANGVANLVSAYGIDPRTVLQAMGISINAETGQAALDPQVETLNRRIAQLEQSLTSHAQKAENDRQEAARQRTEAERRSAETEFSSLALAKDEKGNLKFPHYERVKGAMIQLAANGQAETWEDAHSKAVWLDPELRQQMLESERKAALEAAEKSRLEAVAKAKGAQRIVTTNSLPGGSANAKGLDAILSAAIDKHM